MKLKLQKMLLLIAGLTLSFSASAEPERLYDFMVDGMAFNINDDGKTCSITWDEIESGEEYEPKALYSGDFKIPETVTYKDKTYTVTRIENEAFGGSPELTSVTIPNTITEIGYYAFFDCPKLTHVEIPESVTEIGINSFSLSGLTSISLPESIKHLQYELFAFSNLKSIVIPNSVTAIEDRVFAVCKNLKEITIGKNVAEIAGSAFTGCDSIETIKCLAIIPPTLKKTEKTTEDTFREENYNNVTLYVPESALEEYKQAPVWKEFKKIEVYEEPANISFSTIILIIIGAVIVIGTVILFAKKSKKK